MRHLHPIKQIIIIASVILLMTSCNKPPFIPDYTNAGGYVIAKEVCKANEADDYWLIDLTYYPNTPQYGDTLVLNGTTYTNVIKTKGLDQRLKQIGMKVSLDFKTVTPDKVETTGCSVTNPVTYRLKELFIINQFEIR
jgi:hypothetical protein